MQFTIPGPPQGKARARTVYNPHLGRSISFTPDKTVLYENLIKSAYEASKDKVAYIDKEPLTMHITAYFEPAKSTTKKNRAKMLAGEILPTKKPDIDNVAKVVCDALNGLAYRDDTQIVRLILNKRYTDGLPRVEVGIWPYKEEGEDEPVKRVD